MTKPKTKPKPKSLCLPALIASLICAAVIVVVLYVPQPVGLANNGDFLRVIETNGITYVNGDPGKDRFAVDYTMTFRGDTTIKKFLSIFVGDYGTYRYVTSQSVPVIASKLLNVAWDRLTGRPASHYSIIWLGLIYTAAFVWALYLILSFVWRRFGRRMFVFAALAGLFVFCDQGYLLYFNSFYGEAMQYSSTFLAIGLFLRLCEPRAGRRLGAYLPYYAAVLLMTASKYAYAPAGALFGLLPLALWRGPDFKKRLAVGGAVLAIAWAAALTLYFTPRWIERDTNFDAVFAGVLKYSSTPAQDLAELGLDPGLAVLQGREAYQDGYPVDVTGPAFDAQFYDKISKGKILEFYLRRPGRLWQAMKIEASWSKAIRPGYLANYQNPAAPDAQSRRFSLWETVRGKIGVSNIWVTLGVFGLTLGVIVFESAARIRKRRADMKIQRQAGEKPAARAEADAGDWGLAALLAAVLLSAGYNFVIPYISNGICDIAKHMFGFIALYDLMIVILIGYAGRWVGKVWRKTIV